MEKALIRYLIVFTVIIVAVVGCTEEQTETIALVILAPKKSNTPITNLNLISLIVQYDPKKASSPAWYFSKDNGKNWKEMTVLADHIHQSSYEDGPYSYAAEKWKPETDSLGQNGPDTILIKATCYGGRISVQEGPFIVR
jgi:hypothetical protein